MLAKSAAAAAGWGGHGEILIQKKQGLIFIETWKYGQQYLVFGSSICGLNGVIIQSWSKAQHGGEKIIFTGAFNSTEGQLHSGLNELICRHFVIFSLIKVNLE